MLSDVTNKIQRMKRKFELRMGDKSKINFAFLLLLLLPLFALDKIL